jgi:hypothetical protein
MISVSQGGFEQALIIPAVRPAITNFINPKYGLENALAGFAKGALVDAYMPVEVITQGLHVPTITGASTDCGDPVVVSAPPIRHKQVRPTKKDRKIKTQRCDFITANGLQIAPFPTRAQFPEKLDYRFSQLMMQGINEVINKEGEDLIRDIFFGHQNADTLAFTNMPGQNRPNTVEGVIPSIARVMIAGGRGAAITNNFGATPLGTDDTLDQIKLMIARQAPNVDLAIKSETIIHMTAACHINLSESLLEAGNGTQLRQMQLIDGKLYLNGQISGYEIMIHAEWDRQLISENRNPNLILFAPQSQVIICLPDPAKHQISAQTYPYILSVTTPDNPEKLGEMLIVHDIEAFMAVITSDDARFFELAY